MRRPTTGRHTWAKTNAWGLVGLLAALVAGVSLVLYVYQKAQEQPPCEWGDCPQQGAQPPEITR